MSIHTTTAQARKPRRWDDGPITTHLDANWVPLSLAVRCLMEAYGILKPAAVLAAEAHRLPVEVQR